MSEPPPPLRIRPAVAADLPRIREIETTSFTTPWTVASFRELLGQGRVLFRVAERDGSVIGYGVLWWTGHEGELANLAVHPEARRGGVAELLLEHLLHGGREQGVTSIFLEVRVSNRAAIRLYRSRGFRDVGLRKDYYARPREDARVLRLDLNGSSE